MCTEVVVRNRSATSAASVRFGGGSDQSGGSVDARSLQLINGGFVIVKVVLFTRKFSLGINSSRVPSVLKR